MQISTVFCILSAVNMTSFRFRTLTMAASSDMTPLNQHIEPFDPDSSSWAEWEERLELFFEYSGITDERKKKVSFLTACGRKAYAVLRSLIAPRKPMDVPLAELLLVMQGQEDSDLSVTISRRKFGSRVRRAGQQVADYAAVLRQNAIDCCFGDTLGVRLLEQLIFGIADDQMQRRLLSEKNLSFSSAVAICRTMEASNSDDEVTTSDHSSEITTRPDSESTNWTCNEGEMGLEGLSAELDASRKACANYSSELLRVKAAYEESQRQLASIRRENKVLSGKNEDITDQIGEDVGNPGPNRTLQQTFSAMEWLLEEAKNCVEAERFKRLEQNINELETALNTANASIAGEQEAVRRYQAEIGETTALLKEEVRVKTELQAQLDASERARNALGVQLEESRALLEQAESSRHQAELDLASSKGKLSAMQATSHAASIARQELESEVQSLRAELERALCRAAESRLADERRVERKRSMALKKRCKFLEAQFKIQATPCTNFEQLPTKTQDLILQYLRPSQLLAIRGGR
ncbi:myosin heavy chain, muscle-like isoform X2 [Pollicipes pollicipes]|uniref:myosin heavy chain, muscle-like isoform X2 n=1 Tax=Pollicipes pollicipes TaxID=41117 RepID=UPI0018859DCA|nr:myosin heavy chain, muscle-like isoform X2 [Pollicipes pollicipes]